MRRIARVSSSAAVLGLVLACSSCSDDEPEATPPPAEADVDDRAPLEPADIEVDEDVSITVEDPDLGPLTFDAIAAGDPSAAAEGRLVLLLHGFPETGEAYREILPVLAAEGYYAVAPDQRGYSPGARPAEVGDYQILNMAADTVAMATALGAESFHLVGHDWGGAVAWVTAAVDPERVTTLSVLSTPHPDALSAAFTEPGSEQPAMSGYVDVFKAPGSEATLLDEGGGGGADDRTFVAAMSSAGMPEAKARAYAEVLGTVEALGPALNWYRANPIPPDVELGPTTVPTLYAWGTEDMALGRTAAEGTGDHVDAPYEFAELEGEGHWLPETVPDEIAALLITQLAVTD